MSHRNSRSAVIGALLLTLGLTGAAAAPTEALIWAGQMPRAYAPGASTASLAPRHQALIWAHQVPGAYRKGGPAAPPRSRSDLRHLIWSGVVRDAYAGRSGRGSSERVSAASR